MTTNSDADAVSFEEICSWIEKDRAALEAAKRLMINQADDALYKVGLIAATSLTETIRTLEATAARLGRVQRAA